MVFVEQKKQYEEINVGIILLVFSIVTFRAKGLSIKLVSTLIDNKNNC